jgi:hypothetical protein
MRSGTPVRRELRSRAILLRLTLRRAIGVTISARGATARRKNRAERIAQGGCYSRHIAHIGSCLIGRETMTLIRFGVLLALTLAVCGCEIGAPDRASDIQNLNAINDDIAAGTMTESSALRVHDPNLPSTVPGYSTSYTP